jgi:hypothetical protein
MTLQRSSRWSAAALVVSVSAVITVAGAAAEPKTGTLLVSTIGVDSPACGPADNPCRSITRAIANASDGDNVVVEPGQYGDLNRDGDQNDAGEEQTFDQCAVCVRKRVNVYSTHGAAVTGITHLRGHVVTIFADGVNFGARDKGFTLHEALGGALTVELAGDVRVVGNVARRSGVGFFFQAERGPIHVRDNVAADNFSGGILATTSRNGGPGYVILRNNVVTDTGEHGFMLDGFLPHVATHNSITRSGRSGLIVRNNSWVADNAVTSNEAGVVVEGTGEEIGGGVLGGGVRLHRNAIIGNRRAGIEFLSSTAAPNHRIHLNAIFGNGTDSMRDRDRPAPPNCGLLNASGGFVDAARNYWGSSSGPGPDPADEAGPGPCDVSGTTRVEPYSPTRFRPR